MSDAHWFQLNHLWCQLSSNLYFRFEFIGIRTWNPSDSLFISFVIKRPDWINRIIYPICESVLFHDMLLIILSECRKMIYWTVLRRLGIILQNPNISYFQYLSTGSKDLFMNALINYQFSFVLFINNFLLFSHKQNEC